MPKHDKIQNDELRGMMDQAYAQMRAGKAAVAVHQIAAAFLRLVELKPELAGRRVGVRGRMMPIAMRWPALGANLKLESLRAGKLEIEFARERFAMSEAMTYYEFLSDTAIAAERPRRSEAEAPAGESGEG
jgi:hypothetical protein